MESNEFLRTVQSLGTRYVSEYTRVLQQYAELFNGMSDAGRSQPIPTDVRDSAELQRRYSDFMLSQGPEFMTRLAEANINYFSTMADLSLQSMQNYLSAVLRDGAPSSGRVSGKNGGSLMFHGMRGEEAVNAFLVSNDQQHAVDVEFSVGEVVGRDSGASIQPAASFTPASCRLEPQSERLVQCSLAMSDDFDAGEVYDGSIAIVGVPDMSMRISVQVEDGQSAADAKPAAKKSARKKKATARKTRRKAAKKK